MKSQMGLSFEDNPENSILDKEKERVSRPMSKNFVSHFSSLSVAEDDPEDAKAAASVAGRLSNNKYKHNISQIRFSDE